MNTLKKRQIINQSAPNKSTSIINGECSNILNWDDVRFSWAYPKYKKCLLTFGRPLK